MKAHPRLALLGLMVALSGCTPKAKVVNLAIWSNYASKPILEEFTKRTGITVQVTNYSSNEELLAKLQAGASGYDVVVPSDYMVYAMSQLKLLKPLDRAKLPHFKALDPRFLSKPYDPDNRVSVPFDWGTTGIAVNRELYKGRIRGWKDVFSNPELAGKFTLLDDARETIGAALKAQGLSLNSQSDEDLKKARELLASVRPKVKAFTSEPMMALQNGETAVAHAYVSDALQARRATGGKIEYILPEEGGTLWVDNLVIPAKAPHSDEAHAFIDYLLEPASNAATVQAVLVSPANRETIPLLPQALQADAAMFPSEKALARFEMMRDLGAGIEKYERIWTDIKAEH